MLGQRTEQAQGRSKTYLNIKNGTVVKRTPSGEESYTFVEGKLESISQKERTFRNEVVIYWYIDLRDNESGELYSIGFPYGSNTFKSVILALASPMGLTAVNNGSIVRIEPYTRNGYDKIVVWGEGVKLDWIVKTLPPVTQKMIGGRSVKDDSERMSYICSLVEQIQRAATTPTGNYNR